MAGRMRSVTKQVQGTPHEFQKRYGPWVLIAGASEGVGAALAREMASRSINCMLVARRSEQLERLAEKIRIDFRGEVTTNSDRKSTRLNSSHQCEPRMTSSA